VRHDRVRANLGRQPGHIPGAGPSTRLSPLNARETPDIADDSASFGRMLMYNGAYLRPIVALPGLNFWATYLAVVAPSLRIRTGLNLVLQIVDDALIGMFGWLSELTPCRRVIANGWYRLAPRAL
jgi:hypothetical protein